MPPLTSRRDRTPRGPIPKTPNPTVINTASAMLVIGASTPFVTVHRPRFNSFIPDAQMLFHVLGICDQLMTTTHHFLQSSSSWLPIVSQLYVSLLWNFTILRNFVNSKDESSSHGHYAHILNELDFINHCTVPGPLVLFFQSLASFNGRISDITPIIPNFSDLWNASSFHPNSDYARQIPIPAIILDQLYHFSINDDDSFRWYSNVFSQNTNVYNKLNRIGPQLCGSLYATRQQAASARAFWSSVFSGTGFTRVNASAVEAPFTSIENLLGFKNQFGDSQTNWFHLASNIMQNYSSYFNESVPLSSILHTGLGSVAVRGVPSVSEANRNFLYPTDEKIEPFPTSRFHPRRPLPDAMAVIFKHCEYYGIQEVAEQTGIVTHVNLMWPVGNGEQNEWTRINSDVTHRGEVWYSYTCHRSTKPVSLNIQFSQVIASCYHHDDEDSDDE